MPKQQEKRDEMLRFLDQEIFDPILKASEEDYSSDHLRQKLRDAQGKTQSEKLRFHQNYKTPREIKDNYLSDVSSKSAKKVDRDLEDLDLPTLPKMKQQFLDLCRRLEV